MRCSRTCSICGATTRRTAIAGLAAALMAAAQIGGGLVTPRIRPLFRRRTDMILTMFAPVRLAVLLIALIPNFWVVLALIVVVGPGRAPRRSPVRQAYLNGMIPSQQRATILSFDSLMASAGGVVAQPALGRSADVWGYPASFGLSAVVVRAGAAVRLAVPARAGSGRRPQVTDDDRTSSGWLTSPRWPSVSYRSAWASPSPSAVNSVRQAMNTHSPPAGRISVVVIVGGIDSHSVHRQQRRRDRWPSPRRAARGPGR